MNGLTLLIHQKFIRQMNRFNKATAVRVIDFLIGAMIILTIVITFLEKGPP